MMSFLHAEGIRIPDLQLWRNNAMFDNGDPNELARLQWLPSNPTFNSPTKENKAPNSLVLEKSPVPKTSFRSKSQGKSLRVLFDECEESKIDAEIEGIQSEMGVLVSRLEVLQRRKAEITSEKAKETEMNVKNDNKKKKTIVGAKASPMGEEKSAITPGKRKSIFSSAIKYLKEDKVTKQRGGRSLSFEVNPPGEAIQEFERELTRKRTNKNGERAVASRYSRFSLRNIAKQQLMKQGKRLLPGDDGIVDVDCGHSAENSGVFQEGMGSRRVKKRWEIPNKEVIDEIRTNIFQFANK